MVRKPTIVLEKDGSAILEEFLKKHLVTLVYTDAIDDEMDGLSILFSTFVEPPKEGDKIKLYLGYDGAVEDMGEFYPFGVREGYRDNTMQVRLTPIDFSKEFKQKRTKSYKNIKLSALVAEVANRNGLKSKVTLGDIVLKSKLQTNQSDLEFMKLLAQEYNGTFGVKNGTILIAPKSLSKDTSSLPKITLTLADTVDLEIEDNYKTIYKSAEAKFRDSRQNKDVTVTVGNGEPKLVLEGSYADSADAKLKIQAQLDKENAGTVEGRLTTTEYVLAGALLELQLPDRIESDLQIVQVVHSVDDGGYVKDVTFTK